MAVQIKNAVSCVLLLLFPWLLVGGVYFIEGTFQGFHWVTYLVVICLFSFVTALTKRRWQDANRLSKTFVLISYLPAACAIAYCVTVSVNFNVSTLYFADVSRGTHEHWSYVFKTNGTYQRAYCDIWYRDLEYGKYTRSKDSLLLTPLLRLGNRWEEGRSGYYLLKALPQQPRKFESGKRFEYFTMTDQPIYICGEQNTIEFAYPADTAIFKP